MKPLCVTIIWLVNLAALYWIVMIWQPTIIEGALVFFLITWGSDMTTKQVLTGRWGKDESEKNCKE